MELENLKQIVLVQSEIIDILGKKLISTLPPTMTPEKQEITNLLKLLKDKLKSL
jgi:hypothetical protein